jgi:NitT/TauT family transport system substrate-binding protein
LLRCIVERYLAPLQQTREIGELITDPQVKAEGLGYMREDRMLSALSFIRKAFDLKQPINAADVYTNSLLK